MQSSAQRTLTHDEFGQLRLSEFVPRDDIVELANWEFLDRLWVGEAVGFSEWLRPHDRQHVLESLALDMDDLPVDVVERVLTRIRVPVRKGMTFDELVNLFGAPFATEVFADDRRTFDFRYGSPDSYIVSCTVLNDGGLTYLVVTTV
jgi:hypothetical protein